MNIVSFGGGTNSTPMLLDDIKAYMGKGKLSAWDISNVILYSQPVPLSEFELSRPPQSWCYVK